jgi:hypothetical protein
VTTRGQPYSRRFEKVWATRRDLVEAVVLNKPGAFGRFVSVVLRGKRKTRADHDVRWLLIEKLKSYSLIRLIGEIPCSDLHLSDPL